ncbi:hypothetical protein LL13F55_07720 [Escherichia coli]
MGKVCKYVMWWDEIAWQDLRVVDWSRFGPMSRICVWFALPSFGEWSDLDFIDFIGKSKMSYGWLVRWEAAVSSCISASS